MTKWKIFFTGTTMNINDDIYKKDEGTNYKKIDIPYLKEVSNKFNCKRIKK